MKDEEDKDKKLESLFQSNFFKDSLELVEDPAEREKIKNFANEFYLNFVKSLEALKKGVDENPEKMAEILSKHISKE
jgi:hypothetical protein